MGFPPFVRYWDAATSGRFPLRHCYTATSVSNPKLTRFEPDLKYIHKERISDCIEGFLLQWVSTMEAHTLHLVFEVQEYEPGVDEQVALLSLDDIETLLESFAADSQPYIDELNPGDIDSFDERGGIMAYCKYQKGEATVELSLEISLYDWPELHDAEDSDSNGSGDAEDSGNDTGDAESNDEPDMPLLFVYK